MWPDDGWQNINLYLVILSVTGKRVTKIYLYLLNFFKINLLPFTKYKKLRNQIINPRLHLHLLDFAVHTPITSAWCPDLRRTLRFRHLKQFLWTATCQQPLTTATFSSRATDLPYGDLNSSDLAATRSHCYYYSSIIVLSTVLQ